MRILALILLGILCALCLEPNGASFFSGSPGARLAHDLNKPSLHKLMKEPKKVDLSALKQKLVNENFSQQVADHYGGMSSSFRNATGRKRSEKIENLERTMLNYKEKHEEKVKKLTEKLTKEKWN